MSSGIPISVERVRQLAADLTLLGIEGKVAALLSTAPSPLRDYVQWQDTPDKVSENVQRLLAFAEAQACADALEAAIRHARAPAVAVPPAVAPARAQDVPVTQAMRIELIDVLKSVAADPIDLKQRAEKALGDPDAIEQVAWHKSIAEVVYALVTEADSRGMLWKLVAGVHMQKPMNRALTQFVRARFPMLYQDPVERRTTVRLAATGSIFDAIVVARRTPLVDRGPVRQVLASLFGNPDDAPTVLTIDGPSRCGKSYLASLIDFLVDSGSRGHHETQPHTTGQHRYALLRPIHQGALYTVGDVVTDLFSQLGWKDELPGQKKSEDGWAREVTFEFRNLMAKSDDVVWVVADRYWDFPGHEPIVDFLIGLVYEATLMGGRRNLRLVLIDFPDEALQRFLDNNGAAEAQIERLRLDWLTPAQIEDFCAGFAAALGGRTGLTPAGLYAAVANQINGAFTGAELQRAWCNALKRELLPHW